MSKHGDFSVFEELTTADADALLQGFLAEMEAVMPTFLASASDAGVIPDFSLASIAPLLGWIKESTMTVVQKPDPDLPDWIRSSPTYEAYLFDFDEPSRVSILRGAYYLGEAFARSLPHLEWAVGRVQTAPQGQPVITGFRYQMEMPVLLVAENTIARDLAEPESGGKAATVTAVEAWSSRA